MGPGLLPPPLPPSSGRLAIGDVEPPWMRKGKPIGASPGGQQGPGLPPPPMPLAGARGGGGLAPIGGRLPPPPLPGQRGDRHHDAEEGGILSDKADDDDDDGWWSDEEEDPEGCWILLFEFQQEFCLAACVVTITVAFLWWALYQYDDDGVGEV